MPLDTPTASVYTVHEHTHFLSCVNDCNEDMDRIGKILLHQIFLSCKGSWSW